VPSHVCEILMKFELNLQSLSLSLVITTKLRNCNDNHTRDYIQMYWCIM